MSLYDRELKALERMAAAMEKAAENLEKLTAYLTEYNAKPVFQGRPCEIGGANICVAEGCYDNSCLKPKWEVGKSVRIIDPKHVFIGHTGVIDSITTLGVKVKLTSALRPVLFSVEQVLIIDDITPREKPLCTLDNLCDDCKENRRKAGIEKPYPWKKGSLAQVESSDEHHGKTGVVETVGEHYQIWVKFDDQPEPVPFNDHELLAIRGSYIHG